MTRLSFKTRLTYKMNSYHQLYSSNQLLYLIVSVEFSVHCNAKGVAVVGGKRIVRGKCISNLLLGILLHVSFGISCFCFHVMLFTGHGDQRSRDGEEDKSISTEELVITILICIYMAFLVGVCFCYCVHHRPNMSCQCVQIFNSERKPISEEALSRHSNPHPKMGVNKKQTSVRSLNKSLDGRNSNQLKPHLFAKTNIEKGKTISSKDVYSKVSKSRSQIV